MLSLGEASQSSLQRRLWLSPAFGGGLRGWVAVITNRFFAYAQNDSKPAQIFEVSCALNE